MHIASSAARTNGALESAVLYTATDWISKARQVRITRSAISPRFAISTLSKRCGFVVITSAAVDSAAAR